jgi:tripartite-type tricarboxylate transporter receptor subunit TctC
MRAFADAVSKLLGHPIVVDNKPGGSGALAAAYVASAKPDGYTLLNITIPIYRVPFMQTTSYDPVKDFTPIILLRGYTLGGVVKADGPLKEWKDVLEFSKAHPGRFTYTTVGPQTTNAIAMETMARRSGVQFTYVPGKGGGEGIAAVLGGHVHAMVESPSWAALVASGEMRLLFLLNLERKQEMAERADHQRVGLRGVAEIKAMASCTCRRPPDTGNSTNSAIVNAESCARPTYTRADLVRIILADPGERLTMSGVGDIASTLSLCA